MSVELTAWEAEQAAFMIEFCTGNGFCMGMDEGIEEGQMRHMRQARCL